MTRSTACRMLVILIIAGSAVFAADDACEFHSPSDAADAGWYAKAAAGETQPGLAVTDDAKVGKFALEARGAKGQKAYGGLRLAREMDLTTAAKGDKLCFWVKQNAADGITVNFGFEDGPNRYCSTPVARGKWVYVELDLDPAKWLNRKGPWGTATSVGFYTKAFDSGEEYLCLDGVRLQLKSAQNVFAPAAWRGPTLARWTFPQETDTHWILGNKQVAFAVSKKTGAVEGGWNVAEKTRYLDSLDGVYFVESKTFEKEFDAASDRVEQRLEFGKTRLKVRCRNPNIPDLLITKQYDIAPDDNKLVRTITLLNNGKAADWYATPSSRLSMRRTFRDDGFYMGAGYVGPLVPAPEVSAPTRVSRYRISPKGMLLVNREAGHTLAHYRYRVNGHFLFPWVSKYVESPNTLYYTPTGWQFGLATVALRPGEPASIEEHVMILAGTQHDFLAGEYPKLPDVANRLKQLTPRPTWREDIKVCLHCSADEHVIPTVQQLVDMTEEGNILLLMSIMGPWTDYPSRGETPGQFGGKVTGEWITKLVERLHALSPRVKVSIYSWIISASSHARAYRQHPDWFRPCDKAGNFVNLFPGCSANYATLVQKPSCRDFLLRQYADHLRDWNVDAIYLDGAKTSNLTDWQQNTLTQDADWEDFWVGMREVCRKAGPDKALFFNGRANLYADISYIEARSEMRESNWRDYAGLMAATKSFTSNDPGFVIIPLYWIDQLAIPYVNHFIPLGYRPAIHGAGEQNIARLPFVTAGFELKDVQPAVVGIEPNWQSDPHTWLESYTMRQGNTVLLGLIGHCQKPTDQIVSVNAKQCGLDGNKPVYAWFFDLANPEHVKGRTSEKEVKQVYGETGWFLDRTTTAAFRKLSVDEKGRVGVKLHFDGPMLKVVALTQTPAAVMSVDGMPVHFNIPDVRGVTITPAGDSTVKVSCAKEGCEILLPIDSTKRAEVSVNSKRPDAAVIAHGLGLFAKVALPRGTHEVRWSCREEKAQAGPVALHAPAKAAPGQEVSIDVHSAGPVCLTVMLNDRPVFWTTLPGGAKRTSLTLPKALGPGTLEILALAPGGAMGTARIEVEEGKYEPALDVVFPASPAPEQKTWDVSKTVRGIRILRAGTERGHSGLGCEHVAKVDTDALRFEVGSSDWFTSFMGYGFAGIEAEGMQVATMKVRNTFFGQFNVRATTYHLHPYKKTSHPFAGIMIDYHTPKGYTKRVALSMGLLDIKRTSTLPSFGANRKPDQFIELGKLIDEGQEADITIDLRKYAPPGWDGRVWFAAGVHWVAPGRRLIIDILRNGKEAGGPVTVGTDLCALRETFKKRRHVDVPRATFIPEMDGAMDEETWKEAVEIKDFVLLDEAGFPRAGTRARIFYDDTNLYFGIQCDEPDRAKPLAGSDMIWRDDEVELWFDVDNDPATYHQLIVNARGDRLGLVPDGGWDASARCGAQFRKGVWTVEAAIPFSSLGRTPKVGETWRFNLARHRPASPKSNNETSSWSVLHGSFRSVQEFGTMTFRGTIAK